MVKNAQKLNVVCVWRNGHSCILVVEIDIYTILC